MHPKLAGGFGSNSTTQRKVMSPLAISLLTPVDSGVQADYRQTRVEGTYPVAFRQKFLPKKEDWKRIAKLQTDMIANLLDNDFANVQGAFEDFGQGTLFDSDPRRDEGNRIHMMDGQLGTQLIGYHRWHAAMRVVQLLDVGDNAWWEKLNSILGLTWASSRWRGPDSRTWLILRSRKAIC
jgi:hypothetical protein